MAILAVLSLLLESEERKVRPLRALSKAPPAPVKSNVSIDRLSEFEAISEFELLSESDPFYKFLTSDLSSELFLSLCSVRSSEFRRFGNME